jgi:hypothetical protein
MSGYNLWVNTLLVNAHNLKLLLMLPFTSLCHDWAGLPLLIGGHYHSTTTFISSWTILVLFPLLFLSMICSCFWILKLFGFISINPTMRISDKVTTKVHKSSPSSSPSHQDQIAMKPATPSPHDVPADYQNRQTLVAVMHHEICYSSFNTLLYGISILVVFLLPSSHLILSVGFLLAERTLLLPSAGCALIVATLMRLFATFLSSSSSSSSSSSTKKSPRNSHSSSFKSTSPSSANQSTTFVNLIKNTSKNPNHESDPNFKSETTTTTNSLKNSSNMKSIYLGILYLVEFSWLLMLAGRSFSRSFDWLSERALIESDVKILPNSPSFLYSLGNFKLNEYKTLDTNKHLNHHHHHHGAELSLGLGFEEKTTKGNLLKNMQQQQLLEEAEVYYRKCIEVSPDYFECYINLGVVRKKKGLFVFTLILLLF